MYNMQTRELQKSLKVNFISLRGLEIVSVTNSLQLRKKAMIAIADFLSQSYFQFHESKSF